ncbi:MAG TPA: hypothetical protein PLC08_06335 [Candidatus Bipolaricaulis sp.]|nr:hypothetical protein [Candidatus Bipolaricaulis sp.]
MRELSVVGNLGNMRVRVRELYNAAYSADADTDLRASGRVLDLLDRTLAEIANHLTLCRQALDRVADGEFAEFGALQGNAALLDVSVARAATLVKLLPDALRKQLE